MASTPQPLLSDVIERWRPVNQSRKDIRSFWKVSKRFKALSDRDVYSYIHLRDIRSCAFFSHQLELWTESGSSEPSLVVGLSLTSLSRDQDSPGWNTRGIHPLNNLFILLLKLSFVDFGAETAVKTSLLAGLAASQPRLRSIVGLGLSLENYDSAVLLLRTVSPTLQHLGIIDVTYLDAIGKRLRTPSLTLPFLLTLSHSSLYCIGPSSVALGWKLPKLKKLVEGMDPDSIMGNSSVVARHVVEPGSSLEETTCPMSWVFRDLEFQAVTRSTRLRTLAIYLDSIPDRWGDLDHGEPRKGSGIRNLILVQEQTIPKDQFHALRQVHRLLSNFVSRTTFPELETVYWVTARPRDYIWSSWSQVALDLVASGVNVVYL